MYFELFLEIKKQTEVAALIDPEKADEAYLKKLIEIAEKAGLDWFFVGGSTVTKTEFEQTILYLKQHTKIPVILFPGNAEQIHPSADGLLFLSLISGRNPEYLIGQQVRSAQFIHDNKIKVIPTGYILVEGGKESTTSKVTGTRALSNKDEIVATALAGEMLGMKAIYLEAGSGANSVVDVDLIRRVKQHLQSKSKLIVGGGIKNATDAIQLANAGADVIVVGNALEDDMEILKEIISMIRR